jgi:Domain of unknown function (DUF4349)
MKRQLFFLLVPTLILAGCSQERGEQSNENRTIDVKEEARSTSVEAASEAADASGMAAPGIPASVAPNLAFEYRYAFKLPDNKISAVQEEHAEACETLGSARCQVVDMKFQQSDGKSAEALLAFKLDPGIARKFGRDAIASVEKAEGVLADGNVTGTNVGGEIEDSQGRSALLTAQLERLEKRLAMKGLPPKERASLQERAEEIRRELDNEADGRSKGEVKLAMTPVVFTYTSDGGLPGFGKENPLANAASVSANSFATMISFVLLLIGAVAPWALLIGVIVLLWRSAMLRGVRTWFARSSPLNDEPLKE